MVARGTEEIDADTVKAYAQDLRSLLEEADLTERKAFLRSFIKRIEVNKEQVKVRYHLPLPQARGKEGGEEVLPIVTQAPPGAIVTRRLHACNNETRNSSASYLLLPSAWLIILI